MYSLYTDMSVSALEDLGLKNSFRNIVLRTKHLERCQEELVLTIE
jgi:hypothetical protein